MTSTMLHHIPDVIRMSNATSLPLLDMITPRSPNYPFYQTDHRSIFPWISDKHLSLLVPTLFYWVFSLLFHFIDTMQFPYFEKRRIHESPEVMARNKCTVTEVVKAVTMQHVVQTILGLVWFGNEETIYQTQVKVDHLRRMAALAPRVATGVTLLLGPRTGEAVLRSYGEGLVQWVYWWGIPAAQLVLAFFILDTWQYFWHRAFHTSKFLYRHIHSVHHRLYVPYAFGALYNHPVEGFILDTLGSVIAHELSGMTIRQATVFFGISMIKTVDDHAGYRLSWDPCQWLFTNNADYHDIHHQMYGLKANFSQPYFINWDVLLSTRMTRQQANQKTRRISKIDVPATRIKKTE